MKRKLQDIIAKLAAEDVMHAFEQAQDGDWVGFNEFLHPLLVKVRETYPAEYNLREYREQFDPNAEVSE